jgi:hypothetical protein
MPRVTSSAPPKAPGDTRDTMKAIVRYEYGSPDVLELRDIDKPQIADDEVLSCRRLVRT